MAACTALPRRVWGKPPLLEFFWIIHKILRERGWTDMGRNDMQNEYEDQTNQQPEGFMQTDTGKDCRKCFSAYVKGSIKMACRCMDCLITPC